MLNCAMYINLRVLKSKPTPTGIWYEGARAYLLRSSGAKKLLDWVYENGAMSVDWMLNDGIVEMKFDPNEKVTYNQIK